MLRHWFKIGAAKRRGGRGEEGGWVGENGGEGGRAPQLNARGGGESSPSKQNHRKGPESHHMNNVTSLLAEEQRQKQRQRGRERERSEEGREGKERGTNLPIAERVIKSEQLAV